MDFHAAMTRIQSITGCRTQTELAAALGIRQSSISDAKRRQVIPDSWLVTLLNRHGANPAYITGAPVHPYLIEDMRREIPGECTPRFRAPLPEPKPEPTAGDLLAALQKHVGPGYGIMVIPAGATVAVKLSEPEPKAWTMDDLEFVSPVHALPRRPAA